MEISATRSLSRIGNRCKTMKTSHKLIFLYCLKFSRIHLKCFYLSTFQSWIWLQLLQLQWIINRWLFLSDMFSLMYRWMMLRSKRYKSIAVILILAESDPHRFLLLIRLELFPKRYLRMQFRQLHLIDITGYCTDWCGCKWIGWVCLI